MKGIKIFGNEIKPSQFADDTTLCNADLGSLQEALKMVEEFWKTSGSFLKCEENKAAIWLGK